VLVLAQQSCPVLSYGWLLSSVSWRLASTLVLLLFLPGVVASMGA
jgi:hypothetical protein